MVSTHENWIRIFDIPDTSKHKNGFTIYKVVSMLYPESCPDAVTKVTVWKRFNDFKKLLRDLKYVHKKLNLKSKFPTLPRGAVFKRFDEETIKERRQCMLNFLEYVGNNSQLFTSSEFVKFLETSHTPVKHLNSNINTIRAELNLPEDPEVCTYLSKSDEEKTVSDTDSITTISSLSPSIQADINEAITQKVAYSNLKKLNSTSSINSQASSRNSDTVSIMTMLDNLTLLDGQIYPTPPNTPSSSMTGDHMQYIIDSSVHISLAVELENDRKYEEAYAAYETAVKILLKYGKDDPNYDRRQMVRYKTNKYLLKAEKIYNMHLAPEIRNVQLSEDAVQHVTNKRPLFDLYKFKVVKIISSGMLVLHSELQKLFYIKVIHKTMEFLNDNLILPENVPYMVKLHCYYNCENALFLVLEYCSGTKISEYVRKQKNLEEIVTEKDKQILRQIQNVSDDDSELSFSDLINEYTSNRLKSVNVMEVEKKSNCSDESYVKVDLEESAKSTKHEFAEAAMSSDNRTSTMHVNEESNFSHSDNDLVSFDQCMDVLILPETTVVKWAAQLLLALEKLHTLGVTCRDLETKNLLIDDNSDLVLTYMCNVKDLCDLFSNGINHNLAPEVYSYHDITTAVDWWSFGAILYELLIGMPLTDIHPNGLDSFSHLKIPKYVSAEGRSILKQLLIYEPHDRLGTGINGIENIKSHPFFNSIAWDELQGVSATQ